eukprot:278128-Chlamydomonas_euryale.AAC.5
MHACRYAPCAFFTPRRPHPLARADTARNPGSARSRAAGAGAAAAVGSCAARTAAGPPACRRRGGMHRTYALCPSKTTRLVRSSSGT